MHHAPPQTTFRPASRWFVAAGTGVGLVTLAGAILSWMEPSIPSGFIVFGIPEAFRLPSWAVVVAAGFAVSARLLRLAVAPLLPRARAEALSRLATLASCVALATLLAGAALLVRAVLINSAPWPDR